jgi:nicotinamidase-related amidase
MSGERALVVIDVQRGFEDPSLGASRQSAGRLLRFARITGINLQDEFAEVVTTAAACT